MKKISSKKKVFVISLIAVLVASVFAVSTTSNEDWYPELTVTKEVWNETSDAWEDLITADIGDTVQFKITAEHTGTDYLLYDFYINDTLPSNLEYANNATFNDVPRAPDTIEDDTNLSWVIPWSEDAIPPDGQFVIIFNATVIEAGTAVNVVNVTCTACDDTVHTEEDNATVVVEDVDVPDITVEKKVSLDNDTWVEEVTTDVDTDVYFKILVTNTGEVNFTNVNLTDDLPSFLEYNDDANISTSNVTDNQINWSFSLNISETIEIVFSANATKEGEANNTATVNSDEDVTDGDAALVNVTDQKIPDIAVEKYVSVDNSSWLEEANVGIGDDVYFKILVNNTGETNLSDVNLSDTLPSFLEYNDDANISTSNVTDNQINWSFSLNISETIEIVFSANATEKGKANNTATAVDLSTEVTDEDTALVNVTALPGTMTVEKKVLNETGVWVDEINASIGDTVRFNLTVSYTGYYMLYDIYITDELPDGLKYANNATHTPTNVSADNKTIWWNLTDQTDVIEDGEHVSIEFDALVMSNETHINLVNVTSNECSGITVYGEDNATVTTKEKEPELVVEKTIWDNTTSSWVDEVSVAVLSNVRFNITIRNNGDTMVYNITVTDTLPDILEYIPGSATVVPSNISTDKQTIIWEKAALAAQHNWSVEFTARAVTCDLPASDVNVVNVSSHVCGGKIGYITDDARVNVVTDTEPPTSEVNEVGWHKTTPINITADAEDDVNGTGVARVELWYGYTSEEDNPSYYIEPTDPYGVDDDPSDGWSWEFNFTHGEGEYEFYSIAVDQAGNREAPPETADAVGGYDLTPPSSTCSLSGTRSNDWYNSAVTVTLSGTDALSGIKNIYYKIDGGNKKTYDTAFEVDSQGNHTLEYWAEDNAGNIETPHNSRSFKIDKEGPIIGITRPETGYKYYFDTLKIKQLLGNTPKIIGAITIQMNATDVDSGINTVEFYIDDELKADDDTSPYEWKWTPPFSLFFKPHTIKVMVYDNAGNKRTDLLDVKTKCLRPGGGGNETQPHQTSSTISSTQQVSAQQMAVTAATINTTPNKDETLQSTNEKIAAATPSAGTSEKLRTAATTLR